MNLKGIAREIIEDLAEKAELLAPKPVYFETNLARAETLYRFYWGLKKYKAADTIYTMTPDDPLWGWGDLLFHEPRIQAAKGIVSETTLGSQNRWRGDKEAPSADLIKKRGTPARLIVQVQPRPIVNKPMMIINTAVTERTNIIPETTCRKIQGYITRLHKSFKNDEKFQLRIQKLELYQLAEGVEIRYKFHAETEIHLLTEEADADAMWYDVGASE